MTREDFGSELFDAIKTCSQAQQVLSMISVNVHRNRDSKDLAVEYGRLKDKAKNLATHKSISDEDAARLMRQYPWLGH